MFFIQSSFSNYVCHADPNLPGEDFSTSLHCAVSYGHALTAQTLLAAGATVGALASGGRQPLHYATYYGHIQCVALLLECNSDPNAATVDHATDLRRAASDISHHDAHSPARFDILPTNTIIYCIKKCFFF